MNAHHIYCLPDQNYNPAVKGNILELPIKEMSWENFEKLCLKIINEVEKFPIVECDILGRKGQKQYGIDIYARLGIDSYNSYQCKRYQKISTSELESFFNDFEKGDWYSKTKKFVLCTSAEFSDSKLQTKFQSIKQKYENKGLKVEKWDSSYFNRVLKDHPKIVYDFFGENWCKDFCGEVMFKMYSKEFNTRLDAIQIAEYKEKLGSFYSHVFNTFDRGLPSLEESSLKIEDRFVMLDSIKNIPDGAFFLEEENVEDTSMLEAQIMDLPFDVMQNDYDIKLIKGKEAKFNNTSYKKIVRSGLDTEIENNSIIIGDAGYGKSTFLRYLALNLLCNLSNSSKSICLKFGQLIPVYIPFAYLTSKLNENRNRSLLDVLKLWFLSHDKEELFALVKSAFCDKRLLIIVDGIDEYTSIDIAEVALNKLNIYKENDEIILILSSRPYGYKILKDYLPKVAIHKIAPLSINQQKQIVGKWLQEKYTDSEDANRELDLFIDELSKTSDLKELAETPLLLNILLVQKLKNLILPRNKYSAYNEITEHLINKHYQKRISSANAEIEPSLSELRTYWKDIFSIVAFEFQTKSFDGVLSKNKVRNIVKTYLGDSLGYSDEKKIRIADKFTEFGINNIGILVEKSNKELAFIHRQFQEFLTSNHLIAKDNIEGILEMHSENPRWEQSIIFFFNNRLNNNQFNSYFNIVKSKSERLGYKIALSNKNCPLNIAKDNFEEVLDLFKKEQIASKKRILLDIILLGVSNPKINDQYLNFVNSFVPNSFKYQDLRISPLERVENFQEDNVIINFLFDHLLNGIIKDKVSASKTLRNACTNPKIVTRLIDLSYKSHNIQSRTYAINALLNQHVDRKIIKRIIDDYEDCPCEEIKYIVISAKVFLGIQRDEDLDTLLKISKKAYAYNFEEEMFWTYSNGWKTSDKLKNRCLEIISQEEHYSLELSKSDAWMILFHNFNKDGLVIAKVEEELKKKFPFSGVRFDSQDIIIHIGFYFKENKKITNAVIKKILSSERDYFSRDESHLCLISKDQRIKKILIDKIKSKKKVSYWEIYPLVENWRHDNDANDIIKEYLRKDDIDGSLTLFVSKIFEKKEAMEICKKVLFGNNYFKNRALKPLIELDQEYFEQKLLDTFIDDELDKYSKTDIFQPFWSVIWYLIKYFPNNNKVQKLIDKYIDQSHLFFDALIDGKGITKEILNSILQKSLPLTYENRISIIEEICNHEKYDNIVKSFHLESDPDCKTLLLHNFFKKNDAKTGLKIAEKLSLSKGAYHDVDISLGLLGYMHYNKLDEYFKLVKEKDIRYSIQIRDYRGAFDVGEYYFKCLDLYFDHLYELFNLESNENSYWNRHEKENLYKLLIKYHSDSFNSKSYIFNFIKDHYKNIKPVSFIHFLLDEYPNDSLTSQMIVDLIEGKKVNKTHSFSQGLKIGKLYSGNDKIKNLLIQNISNNINLCLTALIIGWINEPIIDLYYTKYKEEKEFYLNDADVVYLLLLAKYTQEDVKSFLGRLVINERDIFEHQPHFINPLIYRINHDADLQEYIMGLLLKTNSHFEKLLYFSILKEIDYKSYIFDDWINTESNVEESSLVIGYNIIENRYQSLSELINQ